MKKYSCVLFDLDGTLANTFPGIFHSYQYAAKMMELSLPTEQIVGELIGAPLTEVYEKKFGLNDNDVPSAIRHYREYYADKGVKEVEPYSGMKETLAKLKNSGFQLGVTTLKKESFAREILDILGFTQYFNIIIGMDDKDVLTKSDMIKRALQILQKSENETLLVGDSSYDAIGAFEAGIDFIGVTYGFGFKCEKDLKAYDNIGAINNPNKLLDYLNQIKCSK